MKTVCDSLFGVFLLYFITDVLKEPLAVVHASDLFGLVLFVTVYIVARGIVTYIVHDITRP